MLKTISKFHPQTLPHHADFMQIMNAIKWGLELPNGLVYLKEGGVGSTNRVRPNFLITHAWRREQCETKALHRIEFISLKMGCASIQKYTIHCERHVTGQNCRGIRYLWIVQYKDTRYQGYLYLYSWKRIVVYFSRVLRFSKVYTLCIQSKSQRASWVWKSTHNFVTDYILRCTLHRVLSCC